MKPPGNPEKYAKEATIHTNREVSDRVLKKMHEAYESSASLHSAGSRPGYWDLVFGNRLSRFAAAAVILLAALTLIGEFGRLLPGGGVAWAEVTRRFQSVPFFNATIYMKEDATAEPRQMELWMSRDGRARVRVGTQVIFGRRGRVTDAFDVKSRATVEPDDGVAFFLRKLGETEEFSLDAVIRVMFGGEMQDVTPLVNPDAVISQDVVVFDVDLPGTPEWVRIWALRESRLPVRITVWNPRDGASTDAILSYSREQQDEFFDPNAFETQLEDRSAGGQVNIAYAFLKDPGGRNVTPKHMFADTGYHMPVVARAGMTVDGAFWVLARQSLNQMPDGGTFHGFARIEDDSGRDYFQVGSYYRDRDDTSLDVFVPIDFPFDERRPGSVTLVCDTTGGRPGGSPQIVGSMELTQWESGVPCPGLYEGIGTSRVDFAIRLARHLVRPEHAERLNRLLKVIPDWKGQPEEQSLLLFWQEMAYRRKDFQEILRIGPVLTSLSFENPRQASRYHFTEYIVALAATGQLDEAERLFRQVDAVDDMSPGKSDERYYRTYLGILIRSLAGGAELTVDQISDLLGFNITEDDAYRRAAQQGARDASSARPRKAAQRCLPDSATRYQTHRLPQRG